MKMTVEPSGTVIVGDPSNPKAVYHAGSRAAEDAIEQMNPKPAAMMPTASTVPSVGRARAVGDLLSVMMAVQEEVGCRRLIEAMTDDMSASKIDKMAAGLIQFAPRLSATRQAKRFLIESLLLTPTQADKCIEEAGWPHADGGALVEACIRVRNQKMNRR
jgi:hypothetical protein